MECCPPGRENKALLILLALGTGSMTSVTLLHLVPEAMGRLGEARAAFFVLMGYALLYVVGWAVHHACTHPHDVSCNHHDPRAGIAVNMIASCAHSLQDGLMLGASFLHGSPYGFTALYATLLHEIPKKVGDYAFVRPKTSFIGTIALLLMTALVTAGTAVFIFAIGIHVEELPWLTGLLAGGFAYYVWGHMLPDLLHRVRHTHASRILSAGVCLAGFLGMTLLMQVLIHEH